MLSISKQFGNKFHESFRRSTRRSERQRIEAGTHIRQRQHVVDGPVELGDDRRRRPGRREFDAGQTFEMARGQMRTAAIAAGCIIELSRVRLGMGD